MPGFCDARTLQTTDISQDVREALPSGLSSAAMGETARPENNNTLI